LIDGIEAIKKPDQCLSREPEKREPGKEESQEEEVDLYLMELSLTGTVRSSAWLVDYYSAAKGYLADCS
jgi:cytochrome c oxidase subunit IV